MYVGHFRALVLCGEKIMKDLLVLSSYPPKGTVHSERVVGVATYTKMLLTEIVAGHPEKKITVLAETFDGKDHYEEDGIMIERSWKRGHIGSLLQLFTKILFRSERTVFVSFEIYMFGGAFSTGLSLLSLSLLRLFGKRIVITLHQAPSSFSDFVENPFLALLLNLGKQFFYGLVFLASSEIVVFEEQLKENIGGGNKVRVIPHFVPVSRQLNKIEARRELELPKDSCIALYFGFLAPYKGVDRLIAYWQKTPDFSLILAGGVNPNHTDNTNLKRFVRKVRQNAIAKHIMLTDFVPEDKIPYYFSACDIVVLPYKTFLSSSGPLSLAFSYERPVLFSKALMPYAKTPDIAHALEAAKLKMEEITYADSPESFTDKLIWMKTYREKGAFFSSLMKKSRAIEHIAEKYMGVLFEK
jgi:glycosyltransferase involved in cell wall biosynthesis